MKVIIDEASRIQLGLDILRMKEVYLKLKNKRSDEIEWTVHKQSDNNYVGIIKYFPYNNRYKAYGNIKTNFTYNKDAFIKLCRESEIESILLED